MGQRKPFSNDVSTLLLILGSFHYSAGIRTQTIVVTGFNGEPNTVYIVSMLIVSCHDQWSSLPTNLNCNNLVSNWHLN